VICEVTIGTGVSIGVAVTVFITVNVWHTAIVSVVRETTGGGVLVAEMGLTTPGIAVSGTPVRSSEVVPRVGVTFSDTVT
jgi:hypothetical protein